MSTSGKGSSFRVNLRRATLCAAFVLVLACAAEERDFSSFDGRGSGGSSSGGKGGGAGAGKGGSSGSAGASVQGGDAGEPASSAGEGGVAGTAGSSAGSGASSGEGGAAGEASGGESGQGNASGTGASSGTDGGSGGAPPGCTTDDPDCECVGGVVVARDRDEDGQGALTCEENPGTDCDDLDQGFIRNACGGCTEDLGGTPGASCNQCGTLSCSGSNALVCSTPNPVPRRCLNTTVPQVCVSTNWESQATCSGANPRCLDGACVECTPGTFRCEDYPQSDDQIIRRCLADGFWESSWLASCYGSSSEVCNANTGTCVLGMLHPRDASFEVIPALGLDPEEYRRGIPTDEVLDRATGFRFG